jgi:hypothetical protein
VWEWWLPTENPVGFGVEYPMVPTKSALTWHHDMRNDVLTFPWIKIGSYRWCKM